MKTSLLVLFLAAGSALAVSTNVEVRVAGRLQSASEIEQLVVAHARRAKMQFEFGGVRPYFSAISNATAVVSMWCAQTNGSYFYATVDRRGGVQAQELMRRDADAIRALLASVTTNAINKVWLGPGGQVEATTILSDKDEGELFWLRRVRDKWMLHNRGTWKTSLVPVLAPKTSAD